MEMPKHELTRGKVVAAKDFMTKSPFKEGVIGAEIRDKKVYQKESS